MSRTPWGSCSRAAALEAVYWHTTPGGEQPRVASLTLSPKQGSPEHTPSATPDHPHSGWRMFCQATLWVPRLAEGQKLGAHSSL